MSKLQELRNKAKSSTKEPTNGKQQLAASVSPMVAGTAKPQEPGKVLPDQRTIRQSGVDVSIADKTTALAVDFALMAAVPKEPEGGITDEWFASLTPQQQAAYRFDYDIASDLKAGDDVKTSSLRWYHDLVAIYTVPSKDDASKLECLLDQWPTPDTKTGNNPAIREETGQKKDGTVGTVKVDFYNVLASSFARGKQLRSDMESLQAGNPVSGNPAKVKSEHSLLTNDQREARLKTVTQQWQRFKSTIKDAIWIRVTWAAIKAMPLVDLDYVYDRTFDPQTGALVSETVTTSTTPFAIWPKGNDQQKKVFSAGNFVKLDPAKALRNGGTLLALMNSVKKGADASGGTKTPVAKQVPLTQLTIEGTYAEQAAFWNNQTNQAAMVAKATKPASLEGAFSDDFVLSFGDTVIGNDVIWNHLKDRYTALKIAAKDKEKANVVQKIAQAGD